MIYLSEMAIFHSKMLDYQQVPQQDWDECKPTSQPACMPLSHCRNPPANWRQAQELRSKYNVSRHFVLKLK
jgi:hypothetical protein